jgi:MYXO-CTERM domain-containing protein
MRAYRIAFLAILVLVALASGIARGAWSVPAHAETGVPAAASRSLGQPALVGATAAETIGATRSMPVRAEFDVEVRRLASNDFPPAASTHIESTPVTHTPGSEGPDGWTAMLATLLLAAFFFVRRTF